ncbi:MAG: SDR family oxidoreductase [Actinomycetota bacterium]|nr:SDR family oxidoreductase [Actinomycetota bacterium]
MTEQKKVLVIGGAGYVGSRLVAHLSQNKFKTEVFDTFWFGNFLPNHVKIKKIDALNLTEEELLGFESVIFLAGVSNDPMAEFSPRLNFIGNLSTPIHVALMCKRVGVKRFVFASSCSVYGYTPNQNMTEQDNALTETPYGLSKLASEKALMNLASNNFSVICLRKGTISGYSPRLRFDLLLNTMYKSAFTTGVIQVNDGEVWRPLLGISDAINAYTIVLQLEDGVSGVYNIASGNYTIGELALNTQQFFLETFKKRVSIRHNGFSDIRNYRVDLAKSKTEINFAPVDNPFSILSELQIGTKDIKDYDFAGYYNIKVFKNLDLK